MCVCVCVHMCVCAYVCVRVCVCVHVHSVCTYKQYSEPYYSNMREFCTVKQFDKSTTCGGSRKQYQVPCVQCVNNVIKLHCRDMRWCHNTITIQ